MNKPLTIVARIIAKPGQVDFVKTELVKLIEPTLAERGCLQYDLHQDDDQPEIFLFFENWETRDLWQDHMQSSHLQNFKTATDASVVDIKIHEMTKVV